MPFYYHQICGPEKRYSATNAEVLAVVEAVKLFKHFQFCCFSDLLQIITISLYYSAKLITSSCIV